jgi:hypothetical protein
VPGNERAASAPPTVVVAYRPHPDYEQALREICAGIEEEGMHFTTVAVEAPDARRWRTERRDGRDFSSVSAWTRVSCAST